MAIAPRCYLTGASATLTSFSPALTGWTNAGAGVTGTAPVAGDLVVLFSENGGTISNTFSQTAGTTWADLTVGPDNNGTSAPMTMIVGRYWTGSETAPTFAWATSSRGVWVVAAFAPDAASTIAVDVLSAVTKDATAATSHTAPSATASASDLSLLFYGLGAGATGTTAITVTAPTSWTALVTASQPGVVGATSQAGTVAYQQSQTGTVTPGAATTNVTTFANMYHLLVSETAPIPVAFHPHRMPLGV